MLISEKMSVSRVVKDYQSRLEEFRDVQVLAIPLQFRAEWLKGFDYSRNYATVLPRNQWFDAGFRAGRSLQ